jgi:hypothetical protein
MSAASDKFENDVAKNINKIPGIKALRPKVSTEYSDVLMEYKNFKGDNGIWIEVKMSHTDNLSNPRVFYEKGKWHTTYKTPAAKHTVEILNKSAQAKKFIKDIAKFSGIPEKMIKIPTTKSGLKEEGAVPLSVMKAYFNQPNINRYIANEENYNLGDVVTEHYTIGIPVLSGLGDFKVRVATRSEFYEVQAEIKIKKMPNSKFSVAPGTKKQNPFLSMTV